MLRENKKLNETYILLDELGHGGGGIVYKAYHERLNTYVVVKKIREQAKEKLESRAEADILKNMKHTYLPRVYDFLEIDGEIYTVIDYIPGDSLDKVLKREGRISQKRVLKWALQLAEALDYLHRQTPPVIHSDIKPANIMLTPEDNICLIDFNISLAFDHSMKTSTGISGGYAPPEQYHNLEVYRRFVQGEKGRNAEQETDAAPDSKSTKTMQTSGAETIMEAGAAYEKTTEFDVSEHSISVSLSETESVVESTVGQGVDERADIYSMGATFYHLLTGVHPPCNFEQVIPIEQTGITLSEGLEHIIRKMMELLPEKRYQNGGELLYALQHIYDLDTEYQLYKKRRRNKKAVIAALYLAGGILTGSGWMVLQRETDAAYNRNIMYAEECMEEGRLEEASAALEEAVSLRPERIEAYGDEVRRLYQLGDYEECIRYGADILLNPVYQAEDEREIGYLADVYYILGNAYMELEEYDNAASNLSQAIAQRSENSLYYRDYAIVLARTGNVEKASEILKTALSQNLGEDSIYMVQGEIAYAEGEYEEAEGNLQKTISFTEDAALRKRAVLLCDKIYRSLGTDYIDQEIEFLEREENQAGGASSAGDLSERLADAYVRKAETDEETSREFYEKAVERFEFLYMNGYATRQMMENIAVLYQQMDEYEKSEEMLTQMVEKYPDSYECYKRLAYLEADVQQTEEKRDRDYKKAVEYYNRAKELYGGRNDDPEMQMLDNLIKDLKDANWL